MATVPETINEEVVRLRRVAKVNVRVALALGIFMVAAPFRFTTDDGHAYGLHLGLGWCYLITVVALATLVIYNGIMRVSISGK